MTRNPKIQEIHKIIDDTRIKTTKVDTETKQKVTTTQRLDELQDLSNVEIVLPTDRKNRVLAIILKENRATVWKWVSKRIDRFSVDEHTYFSTPNSVYNSDNNISVSVYFEGVPIAMSHDYIETEIKEKKLKLLDGTVETIKYTTIKGISIDSKIIDFLLNRHLTDEFTKKKLGVGSAIQSVLILITLVLTVIVLIRVFI